MPRKLISSGPGQKSEHNEPDSHYGNRPPKRLLAFALVERPVTPVWAWGERIRQRPSELSGGEQQRVAIARAVANATRALLADEPTGNLDPVTVEHVFHALTRLVKATKVAMLIATHNMELAGRMDRRVSLVDGKVVELD